MSNSKPVAKSLHTVTVIVQVARSLQSNNPASPQNDRAIERALEILGLAGRDDPYQLAAAALKQMSRA